MDGTMTPEEFSKFAQQLFEMSEEISDNWTLKGEECQEKYLVYQQKIKIDEHLLHFEYHVAYSVSYQVPVLYFRINREDGRNVSVEESWDLFKRTSRDCDESLYDPDMHKILTQMEHPQLFVPFLALHPCRTAELLAMNVKSKNPLLTFVSSFGPYIYLKLDSMYGKLLV